MLRLNRPCIIARWLVLVLWAVSTLAPAAVQGAMAWRLQAQPWNALCVTGGASADGTHQTGTGQANVHEHCAGCLPRLDPLAPAPTVVAMAALPAPTAWLPSPDLPAPAWLSAWPSAQPRAPPLPD